MAATRERIATTIEIDADVLSLSRDVARKDLRSFSKHVQWVLENDLRRRGVAPTGREEAKNRPAEVA